jgi:hypothetical protein
MTRPALTKADWTAFGRAAEKWADEQGGAEFRAAVEAIVRERLIRAWEQGYDRGFTDGVKDATEDDGGGYAPRATNPYRVR